ncbi:MAG: DUF5106 domain-containing protein [Bacteroidales bacterium]|jgi:hypothetical protein|nr:DUF5106 domain-containing protein [Bacteroidales bacterium]
MRKIACFVLVLVIGNLAVLSAQSSKNAKKNDHELVFHVKDARDTIMYLIIQFQDKYVVKDSARPQGKGKYIFKGPGTYDDGLYMLVSQKHAPYLNFIIDKNYHFEFSLDTSMDASKVTVLNSAPNSEMLLFQQRAAQANKEAKEYGDKLKSAQETKNQQEIDEYTEKLKKVNEGMLTFIDELIARNPGYLFSKMQKAYQEMKFPESFATLDSAKRAEAQRQFYYNHFWDNVALDDHRMFFLPVFNQKYDEYFKKVMFYQESDTINKYVDLFLDRTIKDSLMYRYMIDKLTVEFGNSKFLGHDAVFVHILKNNQLAGKTPWIGEDWIKKQGKRVSRLEPLLIGKRAPELIIPDTSGAWHSSHQLPYKYVILWFFDPTCGTCRKEGEKLWLLYDSLTKAGTRNFEVYAIGNHQDRNKWIQYLKDHGYRWINVGGNTANIDYLDVYNIHETGNPAMFILDEKREFILNKRIDIDKIVEFIEQHEKIKALKLK